MQKNTFNPWFALPIVLSLPIFISAQSAPHPQTLVVNGQAGKTTVVQVNGRSYVDVEALAQIANGTVAFKDNQITLTVPASASGSSGQQSPPGFSKEFLSAAIESIAAVREWRTGIATAIQNSISVTDSWVSAFQRQANDSLRQLPSPPSPPQIAPPFSSLQTNTTTCGRGAIVSSPPAKLFNTCRPRT
jgi:hypothetical protein